MGKLILRHPEASVALNSQLESLRRHNAELSEACDKQANRIAELELELADAHARILDQARLICKAEPEAPPGCRRVKEIAMEVLKDYPGVTWEDIIGVRRSKDLITPRYACIRAVYEERRDLSLPSIGRAFNRDHSTIIYAIRKGGGRAIRR